MTAFICHVPCWTLPPCRFLADDRLVVSVGGNDRGIYQWRTCGVASGLPPLPVIYRRLDECMAKVRIGLGKGPCMGYRGLRVCGTQPMRVVPPPGRAHGQGEGVGPGMAVSGLQVPAGVVLPCMGAKGHTGCTQSSAQRNSPLSELLHGMGISRGAKGTHGAEEMACRTYRTSAAAHGSCLLMHDDMSSCLHPYPAALPPSRCLPPAASPSAGQRRRGGGQGAA